MDPVGACQLFVRLWECFSPQRSYLEDIEGKTEKLKDGAEDLSALMQDVKTEVETSGRAATALATQWLVKAERGRRRAEVVLSHVDPNMGGGGDAGRHGCCINCTSRYKKGKSIAKASKKVADLQKEGKELKVTFSRPEPNPSVAPPPAGNGANKPNPPVEPCAPPSPETRDERSGRDHREDRKPVPLPSSPSFGDAPARRVADRAARNGANKPNPVEPCAPPSPANPDGLLSSRSQLPPKLETRDERSGRDHREDRKPVPLPSSLSFGDAPAKRVADGAAQATPVVGHWEETRLQHPPGRFDQ